MGSLTFKGLPLSKCSENIGVSRSKLNILTDMIFTDYLNVPCMIFTDYLNVPCMIFTMYLAEEQFLDMT